jgi:hypothetical protein
VAVRADFAMRGFAICSLIARRVALSASLSEFLLDMIDDGMLPNSRNGQCSTHWMEHLWVRAAVDRTALVEFQSFRREAFSEDRSAATPLRAGSVSHAGVRSAGVSRSLKLQICRIAERARLRSLSSAPKWRCFAPQDWVTASEPAQLWAAGPLRQYLI